MANSTVFCDAMNYSSLRSVARHSDPDIILRGPTEERPSHLLTKSALHSPNNHGAGAAAVAGAVAAGAAGAGAGAAATAVAVAVTVGLIHGPALLIEHPPNPSQVQRPPNSTGRFSAAICFNNTSLWPVDINWILLYVTSSNHGLMTAQTAENK
jgi:hypothetical protein